MLNPYEVHIDLVKQALEVGKKISEHFKMQKRNKEINKAFTQIAKATTELFLLREKLINEKLNKMKSPLNFTYKMPLPNKCKLVSATIENDVFVSVFEEIEEPKYKVGEFVVINDSIMRITEIHPDTQTHIKTFVTASGTMYTTNSEIERKAGLHEIRHFNDTLLRNGYMYDLDEKKFIEVKKRAFKGEKFFFMTASLKLSISTDNRDENSNKMYSNGNYFLDNNEANEFINKVKQLM
jgi:hypothetical protein